MSANLAFTVQSGSLGDTVLIERHYLPLNIAEYLVLHLTLGSFDDTIKVTLTDTTP